MVKGYVTQFYHKYFHALTIKMYSILVEIYRLYLPFSSSLDIGIHQIHFFNFDSLHTDYPSVLSDQLSFLPELKCTIGC